MQPLQRSISWFKTHRAQIVLLIWIIGISIGSTQLWVTKTGTFVHNGLTYNSCGERFDPESWEGQLYTSFVFAVTFALPITVLLIVYAAIGVRLFKYRVPGQLQQHHGSGNNFKSPEQNDTFAETPSGQLQNGRSIQRLKCASRVNSNGGHNSMRQLKVPNYRPASFHNNKHCSTIANAHPDPQSKYITAREGSVGGSRQWSET